MARRAQRLREREAEIDDAQPDSAATPFDAATDRERDSVVAAALARMPETYREPLVLYYVEQRSAPIVAAALGISTEAVHQRLSRGRQLMAAELADLVERTLQQRRTRRNLVAAVLAALPLAVVPARANATTASGGSGMLKLGIAAAMAAAVGGAGYVAHRGSAPKSSASQASSSLASPSPSSRPPSRQARHALSSTPAPTLPAVATANTCASAAAHMLSVVSQYVGSDTPSVSATVCENADWPESQRRCLAAITDSKQAFACR